MENYISTFAFSSGVIQGILLLIALMRKRTDPYVNIFLVFFIAVVTLQVLIKFLDIYINRGHFGPMYDVSYYLPYLYGPFLYFYINKAHNINFRFSAKSLLHFLPFIISVSIVFIAGYNLINLFGYINNLVYNIADTIIQAVSLTVYVIVSKKILGKNENPSKYSSTGYGKWFNDFANIVWITGITVIILFTLVFYNIEFYSIKFNDFAAAFILLPATIYWLSYSSIVNPDLFTGKSTKIVSELTAVNINEKYGNNRLTEKELDTIIDALNRQMAAEEGYLNPELSLEVLSNSLNLPRHHISQAINIRMSINFNDYINMYRVEYAKRELLNPLKQHLTIAAIAFESGFNSISTFNEVFRKNTSMTPSRFKKSNYKPEL